MTNIDVLIQCPRCSEINGQAIYRHKTMFSVGQRNCRLCQELDKTYLDELAASVKRGEAAKKRVADILANETKPETMTDREWIILRGRANGDSHERLAITMGLAVFEVMAMERSAQGKVADVARKLSMEA